jgi:hypothetical protein
MQEHWYLATAMTERLCIECGQRIVGRTDKKFCNDHCRTAWHNKLHAHATSYVKNVNNILRKNRKILAGLAVGGKRKVETSLLAGLGFEFGYFTSVEKATRYCYEQAYIQISKEYCVVMPAGNNGAAHKQKSKVIPGSF